MSKFLKYLGKYEKLNYKNYTFVKGEVTEVEDNVAEFIMSKGYMSTQFMVVSKPEPVIEQVAVGASDTIYSSEDVDAEQPDIKSKKNKKRGVFSSENSYSYMQDAGEDTASD